MPHTRSGTVRHGQAASTGHSTGTQRGREGPTGICLFGCELPLLSDLQHPLPLLIGRQHSRACRLRRQPPQAVWDRPGGRSRKGGERSWVGSDTKATNGHQRPQRPQRPERQCRVGCAVLGSVAVIHLQCGLSLLCPRGARRAAAAAATAANPAPPFAPRLALQRQPNGGVQTSECCGGSQGSSSPAASWGHGVGPEVLELVHALHARKAGWTKAGHVTLENRHRVEEDDDRTGARPRLRAGCLTALRCRRTEACWAGSGASSAGEGCVRGCVHGCVRGGVQPCCGIGGGVETCCACSCGGGVRGRRQLDHPGAPGRWQQIQTCTQTMHAWWLAGGWHVWGGLRGTRWRRVDMASCRARCACGSATIPLGQHAAAAPGAG